MRLAGVTGGSGLAAMQCSVFPKVSHEKMKKVAEVIRDFGGMGRFGRINLG